MTVLDLLDAPESLEPPPPVLELRGAARQFPGDPPVHALHPADLAVGSGDYLSVVGPSGSGKSTLLNLLGLLDKPTDGEYLLDGIPTAGAGERERAALRAGHIGFVFQAFHLMPHRTVLENVLLATLYSGVPRAERRDRALAALDRVGLSHRIDFVPTVLSGGERQRGGGRARGRRAASGAPGRRADGEPRLGELGERARPVRRAARRRADPAGDHP